MVRRRFGASPDVALVVGLRAHVAPSVTGAGTVSHTHRTLSVTGNNAGLTVPINVGATGANSATGAAGLRGFCPISGVEALRPPRRVDPDW